MWLWRWKRPSNGFHIWLRVRINFRVKKGKKVRDFYLMLHISGYFRNSGSERSSLILSEIVFALGDVLSYINNRAFEQVGEFVKKDHSQTPPKTTKTGYSLGKDSITTFNPNKILSGLESVELLLESLAELYSMKHGSETLKWVVVSAIQFQK